MQYICLRCDGIFLYLVKFVVMFSVYLFTRCIKGQHGLAMRKLSVCLSVSLSVKHVHCDKMEERSVQIFMPSERPFSIVF